MGIILRGIGCKALDCMHRAHLSDDGSLYLPHLHITVKLPERQLTLIHTINATKAADRQLLFYSDAAASAIDPDTMAAAQRATDAIAMLLPTDHTAWHCIRCRGYVRNATETSRNADTTVYVTSVVMRIQGAALTVDYTVSPADLKIISPQ